MLTLTRVKHITMVVQIIIFTWADECVHRTILDVLKSFFLDVPHKYIKFYEELRCQTCMDAYPWYKDIE